MSDTKDITTRLRWLLKRMEDEGHGPDDYPVAIVADTIAEIEAHSFTDANGKRVWPGDKVNHPECSELIVDHQGRAEDLGCECVAVEE